MATEKRMIYLDDAKEALTGWETDPTDEEIEYTLDCLPKVDAVEVVRCKDCKHWKEDILRDDQKICEIGFYFIDGNGYCSYGERRTDNERKAD